MLQSNPVYLLWNRHKTLTGSLDPTHANGTNKPRSFHRCLSVHGGSAQHPVGRLGVGLPNPPPGCRPSAPQMQTSLGYKLPWKQTPPPPLGCRPPPAEIHGILWYMINKRAVRILLECILVN